MVIMSDEFCVQSAGQEPHTNFEAGLHLQTLLSITTLR